MTTASASTDGQRLRSLKTFLRSPLLARTVLCLVMFWMTAAAAHSGFIGKWGLRDASPIYGVRQMLDGTAHRPFVYRQLGPLIVNFIDRITPAKVKQHFEQHALYLTNVFSRVRAVHDPNYRFRYLLIFYLSFFSLFVSLFVLRRILLDWDMDESIALLAPMSFALATPYFQTGGGYFYDNIELLFLSAAFLLASRGKVAWLIALTVPASINKETFIFFLPALYPLLRLRVARRDAVVAIGAAMLISFVIGLVIKLVFVDSPGKVAWFFLWINLKQLTSLDSYLQFELTYGLIGPGRLFIGSLLCIAVIAVAGWQTCNPAIKRHIAIAAAINLTLAVVFAAPGELRNLSLLYVGFVCLLGYALSRCFGDRSTPPGVELPRPATETATSTSVIPP